MTDRYVGTVLVDPRGMQCPIVQDNCIGQIHPYTEERDILADVAAAWL